MRHRFAMTLRGIAVGMCLWLIAAPALAALGKNEIRELEDLLDHLGFDPGPVDGVLDAQTRTAIKGYQDFAALPVTGRASRGLLDELRGVTESLDDIRIPRQQMIKSLEALLEDDPALLEGDPTRRKLPEAAPQAVAGPEAVKTQKAVTQPVAVETSAPATEEVAAVPEESTEPTPSETPQLAALPEAAPQAVAGPEAVKTQKAVTQPVAVETSAPATEEVAAVPEESTEPTPSETPQLAALPEARSSTLGPPINGPQQVVGREGNPGAGLQVGIDRVIEMASLPNDHIPIPDGRQAEQSADEAVDLNDCQRAIQLYTQLIEQGGLTSRGRAWAYNNRGRCYLDARYFEEAIADFDSAIDKRPDYAAAFFNRSRAHQAMCKAALARADLQRAYDLGYKRISLYVTTL